MLAHGITSEGSLTTIYIDGLNPLCPSLGGHRFQKDLAVCRLRAAGGSRPGFGAGQPRRPRGPWEGWRDGTLVALSTHNDLELPRREWEGQQPQGQVWLGPWWGGSPLSKLGLRVPPPGPS